MPRLLIADDHPLFRLALVQALRDVVSDAEVLEAGSLQEARAALAAQADIDLVLLDLHMPDSHGLMGLAALRAEHPGVAVAMISAHDDPRTIRRALAYGAAAFIPKRSDLTRLASLTPQQFKVLVHVAEGQLNKQIADLLGISERTVKAHLSALFEKLGVRNRTQAGVMLRSLELNDPARSVAGS